ncbi:adenylyl-sulfate kinase [Candidatus Pelagibacter communis]|uniref:adenylyl-sulfate kinase n=1 Tax=Candidatus Pelagibacter TaxID=198251 RepID=UPI003EE03712
MNKNKILWISGISGVGKTTIAQVLKKKLKDYIWIDGDKFRKMFNNDIGYTLVERNKNAERIINFVSFLNKEKKNILISANLTSLKYKKKVKRKFKNLVHINIVSTMNVLKNRDNKKIYKKKLNVVGKDIKHVKYEKYDLEILNNGSLKSFLKNQKKILKLLNK